MYSQHGSQIISPSCSNPPAASTLMQNNPEPLLYLQSSTWNVPEHPYVTSMLPLPMLPLCPYPTLSFIHCPPPPPASVLFLHTYWQTSSRGTLVFMCAQLTLSLTLGLHRAFPDHRLPTPSLLCPFPQQTFHAGFLFSSLLLGCNVLYQGRQTPLFLFASQWWGGVMAPGRNLINICWQINGCNVGDGKHMALEPRWRFEPWIWLY